MYKRKGEEGLWRQQDGWSKFAEQAGIQPVHTHLGLAWRGDPAPGSHYNWFSGVRTKVYAMVV